MNVNGKLIIIGGAVDTGSFTEKQFNVPNNINFFEHGILKRILTESKLQENSRIEILPTASRHPIEVGDEYIKAFKSLNANNVGVLNIQQRSDASDPVFVKRLQDADTLIITGGDQLRLTTILAGTDFHDLLLDKYRTQNMLIAGTSAGAMAASNNMIYQGSSKEALYKGEVKITGGLSLIDEVIIDTHFVQRGRIGRLCQAVVSNPSMLGIGLGEDTGLLITEGRYMEALGSGLVMIVDGKFIKDTNITDVPMGAPISIENLVMHVMSIYDRFDLSNKKLEMFKDKQSMYEREEVEEKTLPN
jgi:cyanophycinase